MQKSQSAPFLCPKASKVGSSTGFRVVSGNIMALPHGRRNNMEAPVRFDARSEYQHHFREIPHCYASMDRKPLMPYHPHATRSRLAVEDAPVPMKNASAIEFRDLHCVHNRRFVTTHKNDFTGEGVDLRGNPGMIAESTRVQRFLRAK
mmetsp:Transcript_40902/g.118418  ORF Transcript_40902/g.118418 Transcript_40902/m.118418 type:complete len:148 (-) Transcript_40902:105-548(-)